MKITLITSEQLYEFPPMITLLYVLDRLGHEITYITPYQDPGFEEQCLGNTEHLYVTQTINERFNKYYSNRIIASAAFHTERASRKRNIRKIPSKFRTVLKVSDIVWVLHENTFLIGGKAFAKKLNAFLYTMYELCIKNGPIPKIYEYAAKKALMTVVPEYNRAHISKAYYSLSHNPCIIPNKPLKHPRNKFLQITDSAISKKVAQIEKSGKKIVMYMGILSNERPLEPIIEAVNQTKDYTLAVLGARTSYLDHLEATMAGKFEYLGEVKPPYHLEVASHASIAYISYVAQNGSINAVFCAPNKVYEFAGFGIPMLCNDNPGLKYTVEYNRMGVCVPELSIDSIKNALDYISKNELSMCEAANRYYDEESIEKAVTHVLECYQKLKEGYKV